MRILRWTARLLAIPVLLLGIAVLFRLSLAEMAAGPVAGSLGVDLNALTVEAIEADRAIVRDVAVGDDRVITAGRVTLDYSLGGLISGQVTAITLEDVSVRLAPFGDGPILGSLQPVLDGKSDGGASSEPSAPPTDLPAVRFERLRIVLETPMGQAAVALNGEFAQTAAGIALRSDFEGTGPGVAAVGRIDVQGADFKSWDGTLTLARVDAETEALKVRTLAGEIALAMKKGAPESIAVRLGADDLETGGLRSGRAQIDGAFDQSGGRARIALGEASTGLAVTANMALSDILSAPRAEAEGRIIARSEHPLLKAPLAKLGLAGGGRIDFKITGGGAPFDALPENLARITDWLTRGRFEGSADIALGDIAYRDRVSGMTLDLPLALRIAPGMARLSLRRDAVADIASLAPLGPRPDAAAKEIFAPFAENARVEIAAAGDRPFAVRATRAETGWNVEADVAARLLGAGKARVDAGGGVRLALGRDLASGGWSAPSFALAARALRLPAGALTRLDVKGSVDGTAKTVRGEASVEADLARLETGGIACRGIAVRLGLEVTSDPTALEGKIARPGTLSAKRCVLGTAGIRTDRPLRLKLASGEVRMPTGDAPMGYNVAIADLITGVRTLARPIQRADITARSIAARGNFIPESGPVGEAAIEGLRLDAPSSKVALSDISIRAKHDLGKAPALDARLTIGQILHLGRPAAFAPLSLEGTVTQRGDRIDAKTTLVNASGLLEAKIDATHRLDRGRGAARIALKPMVFGGGFGAPKDLSPLLATIKDSSGEIAGEARLGWRGPNLSGLAKLAIRDLSFSAGDLKVVGLDGEITLDQVQPPATRGIQVLTARAIEAGVPFTNAEIRLELPRDKPGQVRIQSAEARFAGGHFVLDETLFPIAAPRKSLNLQIRGLDLAQLSTLADVEGITATGALTGQIPVSVTNRGFIVENGRLASNREGQLKIRSQAAKQALQQGGQPVELILQALEDFRYRRFALTIDKPETGKSRIGLQLEGKNPAVLDGHPFAFNINLQGDLEKVLDVIKQSTDLSSEILKRRRRAR